MLFLVLNKHLIVCFRGERSLLGVGCSGDLADASVPVLCAYGSDTDVVHLSPSTGYRLLKKRIFRSLGEVPDIAILCLELTMIWPSLQLSLVLGCHSLATYTLGLFYFLYAIWTSIRGISWPGDWIGRFEPLLQRRCLKRRSIPNISWIFGKQNGLRSSVTEGAR